MEDGTLEVSTSSRKRKYSHYFWNTISEVPPDCAGDAIMARKMAKLTGERPLTRSQATQSLIITLKIPRLITSFRNSRNPHSRKVEQPASEGLLPDQSEPRTRSLPDVEDIFAVKGLIEDYVDRRDRAFRQGESLGRDIQSLKEACTNSDSNVSSLQQRIETLENENGELKTNLILMQNRYLKDMQKGGWTPKEDQLIQREFAMLQEDISIWSKSHGVTSLSELDLEKKGPKKLRNNLLRELHKAWCCSEEKWDILVEKSAALKDKIPMLVLQTFVANDIFKKIFEPFFPFFFSSELNFDGSAAAHLQLIYKEMKTVIGPEAHVWRSEMLRALSASFQENIERSFTKSSIGGLKNAPSFLFRSTSDAKTRAAELHEIHIKAAKLAQSLWTQRENQEIWNLKERPVFQSSKKSMVAHRLHHLDDGDIRFDGRKVLLCIQPVILAFGNSNAEDYQTPKVWAKAIMLVEAMEDETEDEAEVRTEVDETDNQE